MELLRDRKIFNKKKIDFDSVVNILLCSDKNVIRGLGTTVVSILENISMPCVIHVAFNGDLPKHEEIRFLELANKYKTSIIFYWIDDKDIKNFHSNSYITTTAYYRLLMPYVLQNFHIDRCLYLDTDVICVNDFSAWYTQDFSPYIAFVTKDATATPNLREEKTCKEIGMNGIDYFNSGIMLIDISRYVSDNIRYKAMSLCSKNDYSAMDQDVLNIVLEGNVLFDKTYTYNCAMSVRNDEVPNNIVFVHFTGGKKPWRLCVSELGEKTASLGDIKSWRYKYYEEWRTYASISPWADVPFTLPNNYTEWRYYSTVCFKNGKYLKAIKLYFKYLSEKYKS